MERRKIWAAVGAGDLGRTGADMGKGVGTETRVGVGTEVEINVGIGTGVSVGVENRVEVGTGIGVGVGAGVEAGDKRRERKLGQEQRPGKGREHDPADRSTRQDQPSTQNSHERRHPNYSRQNSHHRLSPLTARTP